jgi:hypothetical protein
VKSCLNPFKALVLAASLLAACAKSEDEIALVPPDKYDQSACWFNARGEIVAFLVLAQDGQIGVPYLVSATCMVSGEYSSYGEAVLHKLNTIIMTDSYGSLQRAFPNVKISNNLRTDQPVPSSDDKMYYFRAHFAEVSVPYKTVYAPKDIVELTDVNMTFVHFLGLSKEQREALLSNYK